MPDITINGARLHYLDRGAGDQTIVFAHGLLFSSEMFEAQIASLEQDYRCIAFDFRGQGRSEVTRSGYGLDSLTEDAAALIESLVGGPCHFCGLSMGGFVGMRLAIRRPELLRSLTLMETSADPEPGENVPRYHLMRLVGRWLGFRVVVDRLMPIMFGKSFLENPAREFERHRYRAQLLANDRVGIFRAAKAVIAREGVTDQLPRIDCPTLVVVGDEDVATVPSRAERIHERIAGSTLVVIPGAGHSSAMEEPQAVTDALREFLRGA